MKVLFLQLELRIMEKNKDYTDYLQKKISEVLSDNEKSIYLKRKNLDELLQEIGIYHQELEFQNDELRRITKSLEDLKNHYTDLFDNAPIGYVLYDENFSIANVNGTFVKALGLQKIELNEDKIVNYIDPNDQDIFYLHVRRLLKTGKASSCEINLKSEYCSSAVEVESNLWNDEGKVLIRSAFIDITEKKKKQYELVLSEERYRKLAEDLPVLICTFLPSGEITYLNKALSDNAKMSADELKGKNLFELLDPVFADSVKQRLSVLTPEQPLENHEEYVTSYMDIDKWYQWTTRAFFNENGKVVQYHSIGIDITERKIAEQKLAKEKEQLSVTLQSIGDGVITIDNNGKVILMNEVAERLTGWNKSEAIDKELNDVFVLAHENSREKILNIAESIIPLENNFGTAEQPILIAKDGSKKVISINGSPIKTHEGVVSGLVLVFQDITEKRKLLEDSIKNQKLESLGVLAGGIAHDFNNLFAGLYGYAELALEQSVNEMVTFYLEKILKTIDTARDLTSQLLTFSKGGDPVKVKDVLTPFIREIVYDTVQDPKIMLSFKIENNLEPCMFDKNQLTQVIKHLVSNAIESMPGGGLLQVTGKNVVLKDNEHSTLKGGRYVKISFRDTGVGIKGEIMRSIFDPFFTTKQTGKGLGLSTCYSIIKRHGGAIEVESKEGSGSVFHFYLPSERNSVVVSGIETEDSASVESQPIKKIIIMDDEEALRETFKLMLEKAGYNVALANNGEEALSIYDREKEAGNIVLGFILDVKIHDGMGGLEAIKEIRKRDSQIPALVTSGYGDDPVITSPGSFGFNASLRKPFRKVELMTLIEKYFV